MFFGLLYFLSLLLIPAYLPVHDMELNVGSVPASDVIIGLLFMITMIAIGFIKNTIVAVKKSETTRLHKINTEERK